MLPKEKLILYRKKREFDKTPEPKGETKERKRGKTIFVVQEHWASHHHFDFRLEIDGVLESWAVPKEIPLVKEIKRLAVQTEPHPLSYANFSGTTPEGMYGAGKVIVWDKGTFQLLEKTEHKIRFILEGKKLQGEYELIRFVKAGEKSWLLFKK